MCDGLSCLATHERQGCCIVCCSIADVNSVWGLDLRQTGRQSLSSQQPTSLSATLAATKSIMFSLLCHFQHHGGLWTFTPSFQSWFFFFHLLQLFLSWMLSSVQATCQAKREALPIRKPWVKPSCILGEMGLLCLVVGKVRDSYVMSLASTRRQSIPQCCSYSWPSCYGCSWHIPHDLSHSLLFVVVSWE